MATPHNPGQSEVEPSSADQFLRQALGNNSGDSRLAGGLLSLALAAAVLVAGWRQLMRRRKAERASLEEDHESTATTSRR